jgi:DNA-binding CsgD family transcriptional regulator
MRDLLRHMFDLQGEVREIGPGTRRSRQHVLSRTAAWVGAVAGCFVVRVEQHSARPSDAVTLNLDGANRNAWQPLEEHGGILHPLVARLYEQQSRRSPGSPIAVESTLDAISPSRWHESPFYRDYVRSVGFDDSIVAMRTNGGGFGFFRERGQRGFGERDRLCVELVELSVGMLLDGPQDVSSHAKDPRLSPRENDVRRLLLQGFCDKDIARRLAMSVHTVNQRVKQIFITYGVHSRAELIALYARERNAS